jgi:hypothetical protein
MSSRGEVALKLLHKRRHFLTRIHRDKVDILESRLMILGPDAKSILHLEIAEELVESGLIGFLLGLGHPHNKHVRRTAEFQTT